MQLGYNDTMTTGNYVAYFKANIFPDQIAWVLDNLKGLLETAFEVVKGKHIRIYRIETETKENDTYILMEFELLQNPVPVALVIGGILGALGLLGTLLVFEKIEKISDSPLGTGLGISLSVGSVMLLAVGGYLLFNQLKQ